MFYPSPADPYSETLFGAHNKFIRGCEEAAVTRLSYISRNYNNDSKEVGSARRGEHLYLTVGVRPVGTAAESGDQRECFEIDTTSIRINIVTEEQKTVSNEQY
jgi:hypothetical protein